MTAFNPCELAEPGSELLALAVPEQLNGPVGCIAIGPLSRVAINDGRLDRVSAADLDVRDTQPGDPAWENEHSIPASCDTCKAMGLLAVKDGRVVDIEGIADQPSIVTACRLEAGRAALARLISNKETDTPETQSE